MHSRRTHIHHLYWAAVADRSHTKCLAKCYSFAAKNHIQTNNKICVYKYTLYNVCMNACMHSNAFIIFHSSTNDWYNRFLIFLNGFYSLEQSTTYKCVHNVFFSQQYCEYLSAIGLLFSVHVLHRNKNDQNR